VHAARSGSVAVSAPPTALVDYAIAFSAAAEAVAAGGVTDDDSASVQTVSTLVRHSTA